VSTQGNHTVEAEARWPLYGITVVHRFGKLKPGDQIVYVGVAAGHRGEAFAAAEMLMDFLKTRAPFWKRATRVDGAVEGWVEAKADDDAQAARWRGV